MRHSNNAVIRICQKVFVLCFWPISAYVALAHSSQQNSNSFEGHFWMISGICYICQLLLHFWPILGICLLWAVCPMIHMPDSRQKCATKLLKFCCELCVNRTYARYRSKVYYKTRGILLWAVYQCYIYPILVKSVLQNSWISVVRCVSMLHLPNIGQKHNTKTI